jgi:hypothetical protein
LVGYKKAKKSINAYDQCKNMQDDVNVECLPRSIYFSSRKNDRKLSKLKNDFRQNVFDHKNFDQFLNSKSGKEYFMGVTKCKENVEILEKYGN